MHRRSPELVVQFMLPGPGTCPGVQPVSDRHGVWIKLIYTTTDPTPREAQAMHSSLQAAGFTVKLTRAS